MQTMIEKILSIPKSFYVSLRLCGYRSAFHLPVLVRYNTVIQSITGGVNLCKHNRLSLGFSDVSVFDAKYERAILDIKGVINIKGNASFGIGSRLSVRGVLNIGEDFSNSSKMTIICSEKIDIGDNFLSSWNTIIMDTDFHPCINLNTNTVSCVTQPIVIGNNVWMGMNSVILKGCNLPNGCVIGANTVVTRKEFEENSMIAGLSGSIRKTNIARFFEK